MRASELSPRSICNYALHGANIKPWLYRTSIFQLDMIFQKIYIARILPLHQSLRPSSIAQLKPRLFTQNAQLLLISPTTQRPQLPFLHPSTGTPLSPHLSRLFFPHQLSRLLSTRTKNYLKTNITKGLRGGAYIWALSACVTVFLFGLNTERLERIHPTPEEWTFISRHKYRAACGNENPDENPDGQVDYANQGERYRVLLARLENPNIDGAGLRPVFEDEKFSIKGAGKTVFDVSSKSEAWREGYYGCLMGAGHAAERLDGWVHDTTRDIVFPPEVVIGPSNPRPKPVPTGAMSAPMEENCVQAFENPSTYYLKILETPGLNTRQRVQAALANADWLDFKNAPEEAKGMLDLGLEIAVKGLPSGAGDVVDMKTGVIHDTATYMSSNVLLVTTAMARRIARVNDAHAALPIFLSILRARQRLPPAPASPAETTVPPPSNPLSTIRFLLLTDPPPLTSPSGDEPELRTPASICEEAGVMVHIGEIFFAISPPGRASRNRQSSYVSQTRPFSSSQQLIPMQQSGIAWTRKAIDLAETTLLSALSDVDARTKCVECLDAGMENWSKMVGRMLKQARAARSDDTGTKIDESRDEGKDQSVGWNWIWGGWGAKGEEEGRREEANETDEESGEERWKQEAMLVQKEIARLSMVLRQEGIGQEGQKGWNGEWGLLNR